MTDYPALKAANAYASFFGDDLRGMFAALPPALKSELQYQASIYNSTGRWARSLSERTYSYTTAQWTQDFAAAIQTYLTEAWFAGMEENGLGMDDMTAEWQAILDGIIANERERLPDLAQWVARTVYEITPLDAAWPILHSRLDMWANRWIDVMGQARSATAETGAKEEWVVGETEHCETCRQLNGMVAYVWEWDEAGFHPQQPPNDLLACGGYRCQCQRVPTNKRRSPKALETLMNIATAANS